MWVISPPVAKSTSVWLAGSRLPLPETVDWITPRSTVAVRSCALEVSGEPTTSTATTMAAAASAASATVARAGCAPSQVALRARGALAACGGCPFGGRPRNVTPHFCSAARSFWNCAESGRFGLLARRGGRRWAGRHSARTAGDRDALPSSGTRRPSGPAGSRAGRRRAGPARLPAPALRVGARARGAAGGEREGEEKGAESGARWPRGAHRQAMNQPL